MKLLNVKLELFLVTRLILIFLLLPLKNDHVFRGNQKENKDFSIFLHELEARGKTRFSHTWLAKNRPFALVLDASTLKKKKQMETINLK